MKRRIPLICLVSAVLFSLQVHALRARPLSLEERVAASEKIFVYQLESTGAEGGFKTAVLVVVEALHGCEKDDKVKVCWTGFIEQQGFVPEVGDSGIALLADKHNEAYWFRGDKVEPIETKAEIQKLLAED